jgi:hypothetical protein
MGQRVESPQVVSCRKLSVAVDVCYLRFSEEPVRNTALLDFRTTRGEMVIADFSEQGALVGLELVGPGKPCQEVSTECETKH